MKLKVIATTKPGNITSKREFDLFSGHAAGVCYMPDTLDVLMAEPIEKTEKRCLLTKKNRHHSVFDHDYISLYIEKIPKILVMTLNAEKAYNTSEKSGRYSKLLSPADEVDYYKFYNVFKELITAKHKSTCPEYFTDSKVDKLCLENSRYLNSSFALTELIYSVSYRQFNYLYTFLKELESRDSSDFYKRLKPYVTELISLFEATGYIDSEGLSNNGKGRKFSMFKTNNKPMVEYFGDVYCTSYELSIAAFADTERHRTINYCIEFPKKPKFYVPHVIRHDQKLVDDWLAICERKKDSVPQCTMVKVYECGTMDNYILKLKERKCANVYLELNEQVVKTTKKYAEALRKSNHPRYEEFKQYTKGSRCTFPGFVCPSPCKYSEGINETRKI